MVAALDSQVAVALVGIIAVIITGMLAPLVMGWVKGMAQASAVREATEQARQERLLAIEQAKQQAEDRRAEKEQDWARQDLVAERAAEAARLLLESQRLLADKADVAAKALADVNGQITEQLKVIDDQGKVNHILLNSNMTAAMQADLDGKRLLLAALRRLARSAVAPPPESDADLIIVTEAKIDALEKTLAERAEQQKLADVQIQQQADARASG